MARETVAQLKAQIEALRSENEALASKTVRQRFYGNLWPNQNRRTDRDPAWLGSIRVVLNGKHHWLDVSQWDADPERFAANPPDFSISLSPTPDERASELEVAREKAMRERGAI